MPKLHGRYYLGYIIKKCICIVLVLDFLLKREEIYKMAEIENSKDLLSVLWSGADILRSKMDANEYKDYLLGIVFYKYLSDSFLIKYMIFLMMKSLHL